MEVLKKPTGREEFMTISEVAELFRVTPAWVRAHANGNRNPKLPSVKFGKHRRFRREAVLETFRQLEEQQSVTVNKEVG